MSPLLVSTDNFESNDDPQEFEKASRKMIESEIFRSSTFIALLVRSLLPSMLKK